MRIVNFPNSIGAKLLAAFLAMTSLVMALGFYSYWLLSAAGELVTDTYDKPLMAINYARAASLDFAMMQKDALRAQIAPAHERAQVVDDLKTQTENFFSDVAIARERSGAPDELREISTIETLAHRWVKEYGDLSKPMPDAGKRFLDMSILSHFDMLIELHADHSFVGRRKAVWAIRRYKLAIGGATALGLAMAAAIAFLLARRIVRPLSAATGVAAQIANGNLGVDIPNGADDEAGLLLKTMGGMRDSLRTMMEREAHLRALAEIRLIDALETASEGVALCDQQGRLVVANCQIATFFPQLAGELTPGHAFTAVLAKIEDDLLPAEDFFPGQLHAIHLAGIEATLECQQRGGRWLRLSTNQTRDGGSILLVSDFSQIKEREFTLAAAKQHAEAASAAKSRFLTTMSHELRTPLNAIIGFSEIIHDEMLGPVGQRTYVEYAGDVVASGRHLLEVINSVLDLAKSEAGKMEIQLEPIDLGETLAACKAILRAQAEAANVDLSFEPPPAPIEIAADATRLRQIIMNLLSNAIKFTPKGGRVSMWTEKGADIVTVSIRDTGIGMSADQIEVALTPFGQVDNRLERRYEGTGLGLPLAKAFTELHRGTLNVISAQGKGTTIEIRLPLCRDAQSVTVHAA